ncbi:hypothetical protein DFH08DRAFT_825151 [Mycena albidolilacea]|uniref:Uncharacterized protein n=1 Tax=Mycena albidolilacea TaxID=1033008 RepID=A0AAD7EAF8_9AGAR|nr:hypothetical protein DFH08DRAFT_825151 [Mycena albidolilacea]
MSPAAGTTIGSLKGMAGIMRIFLVYLTFAVYPQVMPTVPLFESLHHGDIFVWQCFIHLMFGLPWEYIAPTLTGISVLYLANQNSTWFTRVFGGAVGNERLGTFSLCFDWAYVGAGGSSINSMFTPLATQLSLRFTLNYEKLAVQGLPWLLYKVSCTIHIGGLNKLDESLSPDLLPPATSCSAPLVALDTPASPKIEPKLWDLDHIPILAKIQLEVRTRNSSLRYSSNLDKRLSLIQSALDSVVISIQDFREALVAITQQVDEELQRYLAGGQANYADPHALPHDTECNEFASESVESIAPAESPFSFHCASSYVDNFVPELFELVLEVAESSVSSETASPHPRFGFEVPDDVHSFYGESKSSSKLSFTLAQPPIKAEYLKFIISWICVGLILISKGFFALFSTVKRLFADSSLPEEVFGCEYNEADRFTDISYSSDIDDAIEGPTDTVPPHKTSFHADHERQAIAEHLFQSYIRLWCG